MAEYFEQISEVGSATDAVVGRLRMATSIAEAGNARDSVAWRPLVERQVPTEFPTFITAGTTFKVDRAFDDWPSADWAYSLIFAGAQALVIEGRAASDGDGFQIVMTPEETQKLNPAASAKGPLAYRFTERVTARDGSGEVFDITRDGRIMVEPNLAVAGPGAVLSLEEQMLSVIEQVLLGRITVDIQNYAIAGRSVTKIPVQELFAIRRDLTAIVWKQRNPRKFSQPVDIHFPGDNLIGPTPLRFRNRIQ